MFHLPDDKFRKLHPLFKERGDDQNGYFEFPFQGYTCRCIASNGFGWEHVSISLNVPLIPDWQTMCYVKSMFWDKEDTVIQFHPPETKYVNNNPYVLHLWRPIDFEIPVPDPKLVG